jgi:deoxyribonuclease V
VKDVGRTWPTTPKRLVAWQERLAQDRPSPSAGAGVVGGCFVCFLRGESGPGRRGDRGWAAAAVIEQSRSLVETAVVTGAAGAPYVPGLLALREGRLLEAAVRALPRPPDVLLVDATGRDHPRRAGLATSLGAVLNVPTVGVTHRPLLAIGGWPADRRGATAPLRIGEETVGYWLRLRPGVRPLAVHPAWRTDLETAAAVVLQATGRVRTPEPLRVARTVARRARSADPS